MENFHRNQRAWSKYKAHAQEKENYGIGGGEYLALSFFDIYMPLWLNTGILPTLTPKNS